MLYLNASYERFWNWAEVNFGIYTVVTKILTLLFTRWNYEICKYLCKDIIWSTVYVKHPCIYGDSWNRERAFLWNLAGVYERTEQLCIARKNGNLCSIFGWALSIRNWMDGFLFFFLLASETADEANAAHIRHPAAVRMRFLWADFSAVYVPSVCNADRAFFCDNIRHYAFFGKAISRNAADVYTSPSDQPVRLAVRHLSISYVMKTFRKGLWEGGGGDFILSTSSAQRFGGGQFWSRIIIVF